ncbi:MAG TPA: hypothetical protein DIU16_03105 [Candidatus Vogelbacteria bacterium]|uniref:Fumarate lyase N-terminal domain-containing protein n=1 Tax=Candidatus Vogelbacteria bacterium RIFOXYD1_FULL_51_18 TaxID=1802440 RepID=A0A1G2QK37_9BACT|nr:MAG: Adenylosuccinate lyase [Parcubacteria group bacterium GW2011_GWC1_51_35]KKW26049.1 MAG: Adenylosuccinate lyase [Parcubacteria group bacterium GW2011_GWF2_52_12]KKW27031.1 MAG: Adenylosuccinate lyase [Parcubacteria group bacterium GW2011_GWF1_52_5]KKW34842.1 MAG: Adenylosuccinate lyase [Parcubacteria group bacterium GW2011_GWB1_53_43]OHA60818.1 MAG: hypothetical protein A2569_02610 [Candidatus Vogelbacteria bacterium RIFOXYD1_FULL_51_18]HBC44389.1 hypothetical protein [Candidatus Vogelb
MPNDALPGNPRYQPSSLKPIFGYDNLYVPVGEVEIATLQTLAEIGLIPEADVAYLTDKVIKQVLSITTTEVDEVERAVTHHDIRAWVHCAQKHLGSLGRWVHIPLTSYDALDTARSLQFARAHQQALKPLVEHLIRILCEKVRAFADLRQIGRTHGQHALPITVGFWLATILNRVLYNIGQMDYFARGLVGKVSGAVGAHNAQIGLGIAAHCGNTSFEERVLHKLGLNLAPISTQILPPEPLAYYLYSACMLSAVLAQFGRDCRHLMRSEIGEICEPFEAGQVGSSTMAHKRNPINFENLEGMWERNIGEFVKVLLTMISEHQRDLTSSPVARDFPIIIVNLVQQLETLLRTKRDKDGKPVEGSEFLRRITVNERALKRNMDMNAGVILAEPLYLALQIFGGYDDAHTLINERVMPIAQSYGDLLSAVACIAGRDPEVKAALKKIPSDIMDILYHPHEYVGDAPQKALAIADEGMKYLLAE